MNPTTPKPWPEALLPWVVAESICAEAERYLGVNIPQRRTEWLTRKAEVCFQRNEKFRKKMRASGESPLQYLRMFMRHWLGAILALERPDLWYALPPRFNMGERLPAGKHPRINRHQSCPLPRFRRWNPARVLAHPRWRFLDPSATPERPVHPVQPVYRSEPRPAQRPPQPAPFTPIPYDATYEFPIC